MHHIKIAIIGEEKVFQNNISSFFKDIYVCNDWIELNNLNDSYDLLIVNFYVLRENGFCVLDKIKEHNINKNIFVLISNDLKNILKHHTCPINYITNDILLSDFKDLVKFVLFHKEKIDSILKKLGVPKHVKGYLYLEAALTMSYDYNIIHLNKGIYSVLAKQFNTNNTNVERAIRHAIEISWTRSDYKFVSSVFGSTLRHDRARPTNKEYIETIISFLKYSIH